MMTQTGVLSFRNSTMLCSYCEHLKVKSSPATAVFGNVDNWISAGKKGNNDEKK